MHHFPLGWQTRLFFPAFHIKDRNRRIPLVCSHQNLSVVCHPKIVNAISRGNSSYHRPRSPIHLHDLVRFVASHKHAIPRGLRPCRHASDSTHIHPWVALCLGRFFRPRRHSFISLLVPVAKPERSTNFHLFRVDLHQKIVHHAARILPSTVLRHARTMRHHARFDSFHFQHLIGVHHRNAAGHWISVQIEIHHIKKFSIW